MTRAKAMNQRGLKARQRYRTRLGAAYDGDSMELLTALADASVQAIITSPPFALKRKKRYGNPAEDEYLEWFLASFPSSGACLGRTGAS